MIPNPKRPQARVPARVLEILAQCVGHELPLHVASAAANSVEIAGEDWLGPTSRAARRAGLKAARFVLAGQEVARLHGLDSPALTRIGQRWLLVLDARAAAFDLRVVDELGEGHLRMRGPELGRWLGEHGATGAMDWLAIEPHLMYSALSHAPSGARRLLRAFVLERRRVGVVLVYALAVAAASLAVPLATQALVNTIAATAMLQQIVTLAVMLAVALGVVAVLRILQIVAVERIHQRWWVRGATDWIRRTPQLSHTARRSLSSRDLSNRFLDVALLQKNVAALLLNGSSLVMVMLASLVLLAFYHPVLLAFDAVLLLAIGFVVLVGHGGGKRSTREAASRWALFAWMDDVAGGRLTFAGPRGRALGDARGELLLRDWLHARRKYFRALLRHVVTGVSLEVVATVAVLAIGGWLVISQELGLGQLVAASVLVSQIGTGVRSLARQLDPVYEGISSVTSMGLALDAPLEPSGGEVLPRLAAPLTVALTDARAETVLALAPGRHAALVGASDHHSRALDLLYGLLDRTQPLDLAAWLDGREVHLLEIESLREQVALVRGSEVVCTTALANLGASGDAVDRADLDFLLSLVDLHPALKRLPRGLEEDLIPDADGGPLSASELRRIALVRALIAKPRLLLIDQGLDRLGLHGPRRAALLDWIFDRARPWTVLVVTDSVDSGELLARCDQQTVLRPLRSDR